MATHEEASVLYMIRWTTLTFKRDCVLWLLQGISIIIMYTITVKLLSSIVDGVLLPPAPLQPINANS